MCLVAILGPGWFALFLTILIGGLPSAGRLARGAWLTQQGREYVLAAQVLGVSRRQLLVRHVLPNAMDAIVVNGAVWMVIGVYIEAGLSIVGLGCSRRRRRSAYCSTTACGSYPSPPPTSSGPHRCFCCSRWASA